jgi:hypothetical protein
MPLDIEMDKPDSIPALYALEIDSVILASINPAPERVVYKCKEYLRYPGIRNTKTPSVI